MISQAVLTRCAFCQPQQFYASIMVLIKLTFVFLCASFLSTLYISDDMCCGLQCKFLVSAVLAGEPLALFFVWNVLSKELEKHSWYIMTRWHTHFSQTDGWIDYIDAFHAVCCLAHLWRFGGNFMCLMQCTRMDASVGGRKRSIVSFWKCTKHESVFM